MKTFIVILLVSLSILVPQSQALKCFTCDNVGSGEVCIENPEQVQNGVSDCQEPNDEFCYTSRLEEEDGKLTFNRGCCKVKDGSPVCPPGDDFQIITNNNPPYTKYLTRCTEDVCNTDAGNEGGSNSDGGGSLVVPGNKPSSASKASAMILVLLMSALWAHMC
ncbi:hypothetical protein TCAL_04128 [Tigriopus californicus]|uniref:UPAR/Ly6 domain-containing protein n=1 Tax=Tigriopus californicus TaxID=6832 RepID=A0A553NSH3_TIGCA|nr:uncharacterized protein LOC131882535 [Tigriopus californicus]TRY68360.1 hypothetical protein TCAL_04128 [Tigriopus californicus]|eukprot:TCALIF_04128-PA protein Name:"Protein of unknown function" AED:0.00 eAED:0.00 QI:134/1/1/1/0/0/3/80/162